jgi:hypothetical protein
MRFFSHHDLLLDSYSNVASLSDLAARTLIEIKVPMHCGQTAEISAA